MNWNVICCWPQVTLDPCLKGVHVGMKVEVVNCSTDVIDDTDIAFWVATVAEIKQYQVLLRYEGNENDPTADFWFDLRSKNIHPVGWCAKRNKLLIPPPGTCTWFWISIIELYNVYVLCGTQTYLNSPIFYACRLLCKNALSWVSCH